MGQRSSKQKQQHNSWSQPPFGFNPNPYGGPPPFLPPGYQPTPGPYAPIPNQQPGFIPPGNYGQAAMGMPQPQLAYIPNDKPKKKDKKGKRPRSEQMQGGFAGTGIGLTFPESNIPGGGPVIPKGTGTGRRRASASSAPFRAPGTPAPRPPPIDDDESYSESETSDTESTGPARSSRRRDYPRRRSTSGHRYPEVTGRIEDVLAPQSPPSRAAYGPTGPRRIPRSARDNPLPPPPRDVYEMTPYKSLLTLPQTTALLSATYGNAQQQQAAVAAASANAAATAGTGVGVQATTVVVPPGGQGAATIIPPGGQIPGIVQPQQGNLKRNPSQKKKSRVSGLMRALSGKRKKEETPAVAPQAPVLAPPTKVQFIPVFVDGDKKPGAAPNRAPSVREPAVNTSGETSGGGGGIGGGERMSVASGAGAAPSIRSRRNSTVVMHAETPVIPVLPEDETVVKFNQTLTKYPGFMNHSPHKVVYQGATYPTATHLHEAMKFLPDHPECARAIEQTQNVLDVYPIAANYADLVRPDWFFVHLDCMKDVLYLKFRQHADLRYQLVETGDKKLVYADVLDGYWGIGPKGDGENQLGKVLMEVRERLRREAGFV